jgi:hypothetical protein
VLGRHDTELDATTSALGRSSEEDTIELSPRAIVRETAIVKKSRDDGGQESIIFLPPSTTTLEMPLRLKRVKISSSVSFLFLAAMKIPTDRALVQAFSSFYLKGMGG